MIILIKEITTKEVNVSIFIAEDVFVEKKCFWLKTYKEKLRTNVAKTISGLKNRRATNPRKAKQNKGTVIVKRIFFSRKEAIERAIPPNMPASRKIIILLFKILPA